MQSFQIYCEDLLHGRLNVEDWGEKLRRNGWRMIGEGGYGMVYGNEKYDYVIKVYADDPGYDAFLDFLEQYQHHPNIVKIKKRILTDVPEGEFKSVALEKLTPIDDSTNNKFIFSVVRVVSDLIPKLTIDELNDNNKIREKIINSEDFIKRWAPHPASYKQDRQYGGAKRLELVQSVAFRVASRILSHPIVSVVIDLEKYMANKSRAFHKWDLHRGNFMIRPSTGELVLTDPLTWKF